MKYQPPYEPGFAGPVDGIYNSNPDAPYVNGNPATGQEGSIPPMESLAHPMRELVHLVQYSGQAPSTDDLEQVRKAIKAMIEAGTVSNPLSGDAVAIWEGLQSETGFHKIRALEPGTNVTLELVESPAESGNYVIRINATGGGGGGGGGGDVTLHNVGDGAQIYKGFNDVDAREELRTLKGSGGLQVTAVGDTVVIDGSGLLGYAPFFPEIETADNRLALVASTGQIVITEGQTFIHRGARRINTTATLLALRSFATAANKVYHLRWRWNAGAPLFVLCDLADPAYNPFSLPEANAAFNSSYDDMLIARVVTNGANALTVTPLANKSVFHIEVSQNFGNVTPTVIDPANYAYGMRFQHSWNLARTPIGQFEGAYYASLPGGVNQGGTNIIGNGAHSPSPSSEPPIVSRYGYDAQVWSDWNGPPSSVWSYLRFRAAF